MVGCSDHDGIDVLARKQFTEVDMPGCHLGSVVIVDSVDSDISALINDFGDPDNLELIRMEVLTQEIPGSNAIPDHPQSQALVRPARTSPTREDQGARGCDHACRRDESTPVELLLHAISLPHEQRVPVSLRA